MVASQGAESEETFAAPEGGDAVSRNRPCRVAADDMAAGTVLFHPTQTNLAALRLMRHLGVCRHKYK